MSCAPLRFIVPYIKFNKKNVTLFPDIIFLPKMVKAFKTPPPVVSPSFPQAQLEISLHNLDIREAFGILINESKRIQKVEPPLHLLSRTSSRSSCLISKIS